MKTSAPASIAGGDYPGKRLGTLGLILALTLSIVDAVISAIALIRSARAGHRNPAAIAGIIFGFLGAIVFTLALLNLPRFFASTEGPCAELGSGSGGVTYQREAPRR